MFSYGSTYDFGSMEELPSLAGDFYHEPDTVTRGLDLYSGVADFGHVDGSWNQGSLDFYDGPKLFGKSFEFDYAASQEAPGSVGSSSRFQEGDSAFAVPEDASFQLEPTSILVSDFSAATIGNCLLDFLSADAGAAISKVNPLKFTIKAQVCLDGLACETKLRVYRQAFGQHIVEMQRRSGDTLAFQSLFRWAREHLNNLATSATTETPMFEGAPFEVFEADSKSSVAPLLDLAESLGNAQGQAEAVQGLLQAATDKELSVQLFTPEALLVLQNLVQIACFSVADPLSRLMCCLAMEAERNCRDQQLLQGLVATSQQTLSQCRLVQTQ